MISRMQKQMGNGGMLGDPAAANGDIALPMGNRNARRAAKKIVESRSTKD